MIASSLDVASGSDLGLEDENRPKFDSFLGSWICFLDSDADSDRLGWSGVSTWSGSRSGNRHERLDSFWVAECCNSLVS